MGAAATFTLPAGMPTTTNAPRSLGWAIRKVRQIQKRTLQDIALEVGSDPGNISRIERGEQDAPEPLLKAIAGVLGLSMADLWQLAELGHAAPVRITAKAGRMTDSQLAELERFADFLITQAPKH